MFLRRLDASANEHKKLLVNVLNSPVVNFFFFILEDHSETPIACVGEDKREEWGVLASYFS